MQEIQAGYIIAMDSSAVPLDEFDDWLDTEHIPERIALPGFVGARRWVPQDDPKTMITLYDLESLAVLETPAYKGIVGANLSPWSKRLIGRCPRQRWDGEVTLRLTKGGLERAGGLLFVAMNVKPEVEADFSAWYSEEHLPRLFEIPGVLDARRYLISAGRQRHVAVYHLAEAAVQASDAWKKAVDSRWGDRVRPHTSDRVRWVCQPYIRAAREAKRL